MSSIVLQATLPLFLQRQGEDGEICANVQEADILGSNLGAAMVELYSTVKERFTVDSKEHYVFSPRDLVLWVNQLIRYIHDDGASVETKKMLLDAWGNEAKGIFRDRLVPNSSLRTGYDDLKNQI